MNIYITYSALHTGSWFICNILRQNFDNCDQTVTIQSDALFAKNIGARTENLELSFLQDKDNFAKLIPYEADNMVIQAHHREPSNLYNYIIDNKINIPIIVPVRNPLLSINTRIWRETETYNSYIQEDKWAKKHRIQDQLDCFERLLLLDNVFFFPIDIYQTISDKKNKAKELFDYCNIEYNLQDEFLSDWKPVNKTEGNDNFFETLKEYIINNNTEKLYEYYNYEITELKKRTNITNKLLELGYQNL